MNIQMANKEDVDAVNEREYAKANYEKLVSAMPESLSKKEDAAFEQITKSKSSPSEKLESLYQMMDEMSLHTQRFTVCKKGCSACCHYSVSVSEIEVQHIERHTKKKRLKTALPKKEFHGQPCVFLVDGSCSIYAARPYVCRRHTAMTKTAHWCEPVRCFDEAFPLLYFSGFSDTFEYILQESKSDDPKDIRQIFEL